MKLIIGLGNPEAQYNDTPHNIGFAVLDACARENGLTFQPKSKFKADIAEWTVDGEKIILAKPTTYYNLAGEAAHAIASFYQIVPGDVLIVHDELALPVGTVRTRLGGSDAGNNGIKSISAHLGADTARLRIGTHHERRDVIGDTDFVLSRFTSDEKAAMSEIIPHCLAHLEAFARGQFEVTTKNSSK